MNRQIMTFLAFVLIGVVNSFGYVSNLINNDNIVDIGKITPGGKSVEKMSKIPVLTNPNFKNVPSLVLDSERKIKNKASCVTDFLGHENCPNDMVTCNDVPQYSHGYSNVHHKHREVSAKVIHHPAETARDITRFYNEIPYVTYNSSKVGSVNPRGSFNEGAYTLHGGKRTFYLIFRHIDERVMVCKNNSEIFYSSPNGNLANGSKSCGYIYTTQDQWGYSGRYQFTASGGDTIYWSALNFHGPNGGSVSIYSCPVNSPLNWSTMKCGSRGADTYTCPKGFRLSNNKSYCYNNYTYYTYSCSKDKNIYNKQWEGPHISTGGDCLGQCGSYGCTCNSSTGPAKNCSRPYYKCPTKSGQICSLVPSSNITSGTDNYKDNYIYSLGDSVKHTRIIESNMTCPIKWTLNQEKSVCEKEPDYKCKTDGFSYDVEKGRCVQITKCKSGAKDPVTKKCLNKPDFKCKDDGYVYDKALGKCKRTPYCDKGIFDIVSNKCKNPAGDSVCPSGYKLNTTRHRCEKPMTDLIRFTEHTGRLWVGKIGDNYLGGYCKIFHFYTKFKVTNKNLVDDFRVNYAKFDDYIGVILNGHYTYVGPYGGNTLYVSNGHVVYTTSGRTGACELSTSWSKSVDVEAKNALQEGINHVDVKVEVAGGGEGYASFRFKFRGRNTIQCLDPNYCSVQYTNNCPSGYLHDNSNDICYKNEPGANTDLTNKVYWVKPLCSSHGLFDNAKNQCVYNPTCPGNDSSISFDKDKHVCTETAIAQCKPHQNLITTKVAGYSQACVDEAQCPFGSYLDSDNVCSEEGTPVCSYGSHYDSKIHKCVETASCPTGYKIKDSKCVKEYTFYHYTCPTGWDKPVKSGFDCKGNCGIWGCECNSQTPPANNCRKKEHKSFSNEITQKRPLIKHQVKGALTPEEFGAKKDYKCGKDCKYVVTKVVGKNNQLCFFKKNGQLGCFTVDGCRFKGTIDNGKFPITELQIGKPDSTKSYSHYISLPQINKISLAPDKDISCYANNMTFNAKTRYCEGTSDKINFRSGRWTMAGEDASWNILNNYTIEQTKNSDDPALLVSPFKLGEGGTFQGNLKVADYGDNDWIGLVFGFKDTNNYYYVSWTKNADGWHPYAGFEFGEMKNGNKIILSMAAKNAGGWSPYRTYTLKIKYGPKYMQLYKNGRLILNYKNKNFHPDGGRVGFYNWSQRNVYFSDFKVVSYPECPSDYSYNEKTGQCLKVENMPEQYIESTCSMYGHVGGIWVKNGIVSAVVDKDAPYNPLRDLYRENDIRDYSLDYYDPSQRIDFWDPYEDHYLGFIEFLKDVKPKDSKDGFRVKNPDVFAIASNGFTSFSPIGSYTYYVSSNKEGNGDMTAEKCQQIADKYNLSVVSENSSSETFLRVSKFLTGNEIKGSTENPQCLYGVYDPRSKKCIDIPKGKPNVPICLHGKLNDDENMCIISPRCVLKDTHNMEDINKDDYAYRTIYSNKPQVFKCSKWTCKDHQCATANCPSGYSGDLHNYFEEVGSEKCQDNICDAMLPYYDFCGKKGPCPTGQGYLSKDGKCLQLTCPKGSDFDPTKQKCVKFVCPPNTTLSKDGTYCIKK